ncbi:MAG: asparagine--tRNA ligase [Planctomycetes bacterium]|jgi:asparaginyl-tRNA synthetase|nr:asparagine--tRNA ligase [Phycisphaerae bacterium]NBB96518.1 asparagine--tRNA ligase [Planctomycetota bacterium]
MERTLIRDVLEKVDLGATVTVGGWVRTIRHSKGGFSFIAVNDGSCMALLQIVSDGSLANYTHEIAHLAPGASVRVTGEVIASQGKGQSREIQAAEVRVIGQSDAESYPMQAKRHSFEFLRTQAHLRMRTNTFGAVVRVRNRICSAIHEFFQQRDFLYVHTPLITASDCEGAGELFSVTTFDPADAPRTEDGQIDWGQDFFGRPTFLTVSGQLEGEAFACSLGNIYTFGPTFRAENSNTPRHLAEFWMVEPEMAFCDLDGNAELAEAFLKHVVRAVLDDCRDDMAFFNKRIDTTVVRTLEEIVDADFIRLPYTEAIERLEMAGRSWAFKPQWGGDLQTEHEHFLTEEAFRRPLIVTDYPASIKPFYMYVNDADAQGRVTVRAMDVLVPKIGEIIGGAQREHRLSVLDERMAAQQMDLDAYWWYRDLRRYGTVPHAGFGLGLERCVQLCTGMANIRDVIPFPRTPRSAEF